VIQACAVLHTGAERLSATLVDMLAEPRESNLIQIWFGGMTVVATVVVTFGPAMTLETTAMLWTAILISPAVLLVRWADNGWTAPELGHRPQRHV
jgi:hypothetical protein